MDVRKGKANIHCATQGLHALRPRKGRLRPAVGGSGILSYPRYPVVSSQMKGVVIVSALVWWAIPVVITAVAVAVVALRSRLGEPGPDPMTERLRLREAMERPIPRDPRGRSQR